MTVAESNYKLLTTSYCLLLHYRQHNLVNGVQGFAVGKMMVIGEDGEYDLFAFGGGGVAGECVYMI